MSRGFLNAFRSSSSTSVYSRVDYERDEPPNLLDAVDDDRKEDSEFGSFTGAPAVRSGGADALPRAGSLVPPGRTPSSASEDGPVGLLAAAYHDQEYERDDQHASTSSGSQQQVRNLGFDPDSGGSQRQQRGARQGGFQSAFDKYDTFPSLVDDDDDEAQQDGGGRGWGGAPGSDQPSSSGQDATEWDEDYEIVPVYVVPLFHNSMVVVPAPKRAPPKEHPEWVRGVVQKGQKMRNSVSTAWDSLRNSEPESIKNKIYRAGQSQLESLSPEQRLLGGIPEYTKRLRIHHAPCVDPEEVVAYMAKTIRELGHVQRYKQVGAAALLPFTFVVDSVVIPGPAILTGLTGYHLYHYSKAAAGSQRLKKFVDREEGVADNVDLSVDDMDFVVDERLVKYYDLGDDVRDGDGVLLECAVSDLCEELGAPLGLQEVLQQLRRRELRVRGRQVN